MAEGLAARSSDPPRLPLGRKVSVSGGSDFWLFSLCRRRASSDIARGFRTCFLKFGVSSELKLPSRRLAASGK